MCALHVTLPDKNGGIEMTLHSGNVMRGWIAAGAVLVVLAAPASGQSTDQLSVEAADPAGAQLPAPRPATVPAQVAAPHWSANAGFEADSHDTGYGFVGPFYVRPLRPGLAFVGGGSVNYLYYDFVNGTGGHTNVRSPGVNAMGGVRFGNRNYVQLLAGPGFKRRHVEILDASDQVIGTDSDTVFGLNLGADLWVDPTSHNNVFGMVRYGAEDNYTWARLAYKEQITNRDWSNRFAHFVGAEVIGQGNDDIRSTQYGGFFEVAHAPSSVSVMFRAGYKKSSYDFGPDKSGPWFAVGFWHRLR